MAWMMMMNEFNSEYWNHVDTIAWIMIRDQRVVTGFSKLDDIERLKSKLNLTSSLTLMVAKQQLLGRLKSGTLKASKI